MGRPTMYSPEVRERAVRMVSEHRGEHRFGWAAICSIAEKFGCSSETLRKWVRQSERDQGVRLWVEHGSTGRAEGATAGEPGATPSE